MQRTEHGFSVNGINGDFRIEVIANRYKPVVWFNANIPGKGFHLCFAADRAVLADLRAALDAVEADMPSPNNRMDAMPADIKES